MKIKNLLTFSLLIFALSLTTVNAQQVEREMVILEEGTGTWCGYCPDAADAIHQLLENGADLAPIAYHSGSGDEYDNTAGASRISYYNITGFPTSIFDGVEKVVGGGSLYGTYNTKYNLRKNIPCSYSITTTGTSAGFVHYEIETTLTKVADSDASNIKMHAVLTESHIPESWMGETELSHVERLMIPNQYGTDVDFTDNETITVNFGFDLEENWNYENCEIIIFLQDNSTKEILQGKKIALNTFEGLNIDASIADIKNVPVTNCTGSMTPVVTIQNYGQEELTSLVIDYSVNNVSSTYSWTGSLALLESEDVTLEEVEFETGEENTVAIEISAPNGVDDEFPTNNTASTTFTDADITTATMVLIVRTDGNPEELSWELTNSDGDVMYSGGPYEDANTFVEMQVELPLDPENCYSFIMYDSGDDGFSNGVGVYQLKDSQENIIAENNSDFGGREETQFFTHSGTGIDNIASTTTINIFPNPAKEEATLNINLAESANVAVTVFDVYGRKISEYNQGELSTGNHAIMLNTGNYNSGLFFIKININGNELLQRLIVE
ncbi:MAG: Omp28-related outer membrane protein [Bacteroidota bacterium]|nr:Omp28-related outer membrane protein [Bacteroidota bacterium]